MKKLATLLPGKRLTMIQCLTTLLLVVIICCVSFGTIFSVTLKIDSKTQDTINEILEGINDGPVDVEIPEKVDVNLIFLIKSLGAGVDTISSLLGGLSDDKSPEGMQGNVEHVQNNKDKILSKDTVNFAAFIGAIVQSFSNSAVLGLCNLLLLILAFTFPLTCLIKGIIALIGFLCNFRTDWGKAFHKVSKAIYGTIKLFPILLFLLVLVPEVQLGWAVYTVLWLCVVALFIGLAASRLKYYDAPDFKYINILQIVSACSFGAFLMFFFGLAKSGLASALLNGISGIKFTSIDSIKTNLLTLLLVLIFVYVLKRTIGFMTPSVTRLACMSKSRSDNHIVSVSIALLGVIIPVVLMFTDFKLDLGDNTTAFVISSLGIVLMFAAEIVMMVLPGKLCPEVSADRRREIVTGAYIYVEATEEATAEEAPAEETPAEETPVEEAPAEEAPVEEAPAEEAPAEEAPVEEAPAEETVSE